MPSTVNQRSPDESTLGGNDLPDWDLGLNLSLPDPGQETPGWFSDVHAVAEFLAGLTTEFKRQFVIGIADTQTGTSEDLHYIASVDPELARLKAIIGVGDTKIATHE